MGTGTSRQPAKPSPEERAIIVEQLDQRCRAVAEALATSDVFLLCTGAGFSADSGLAVYRDIAKIQTYQDASLEYSDICRAQWLADDPELFYGFWGACFNDYRETQPHEGYEIVRRWKNRRFRNSRISKAIQEEIQGQPSTASSMENSNEGDRYTYDPYSVSGVAGSFFTFTSNVDGHSFDFFESSEIRECHGTTEVWQCGAPDGPCCQNTWRAPLSFSFNIDKTTMRAKQNNKASSSTSDAVAGKVTASSDLTGNGNVGNVDHSAARAGQTLRPFGLRKAPLASVASLAFTPKHGFTENENWPHCPYCSGRARPAILMFHDSQYIDNEAQHERWSLWADAVANLAKRVHSESQAGKRLRVVILEIGCGANVRTVRHIAESTAAQLSENEASVLTARVNRDYPLPDSDQLAPRHHHIGILSTGLNALRRIDKAWEDIVKSGTERDVDAHLRKLSLGLNDHGTLCESVTGIRKVASIAPGDVQVDKPANEVVRDAKLVANGGDVAPRSAFRKSLLKRPKPPLGETQVADVIAIPDSPPLKKPREDEDDESGLE